MPRLLRRDGRRLTIALVAVLSIVAGLFIGTAATAASPTAVVSDSFSRSSSSGWGSPTAGAAYDAWTTPAGVLTTDGSAGSITLAPNQFVMVSSAASAGDVRSTAALRLASASGNAFYAVVSRYQSDKSGYFARIETNTKGDANLQLVRKNGATSTVLASAKASGSLLGSTPQTVDVSVTGSNPVRIEMRLAAAGSTAAPQLTYSDSSDQRIAAAGIAGLWGYLASQANGKTQLVVDDYTVVDGATPVSSGTTTTSPNPTPTPTPTPTPNPTPSETGGSSSAPARGSVAVGSASYAIPSGAIFVNRSYTGGTRNGGSSTPFTTVQAAVDAAPSGATIVVRAGTYHEAVKVPYGKSLTIQAYPKEAVWFDGSVPVTNWSASGSVWVAGGWNAQFPSDMQGTASRFVQSSYPMASHPDQVFIDGVAQKQVASASQVTAGTFAVDYTNKRIVLGSNPSGRSVRASDLSQAFDVQSAGTTLQGFGVTRYATFQGQGGTIRMQHVDATLRDLVVTDNALVGIAIGNSTPTVQRVTVQRNGMLGIGMNAAYGANLSDSVVTGNNVEHFKDAPVAGGVKVTRTRDITVDNVDTSSNTGAGMWFDESCWNVVVTRTKSNYNTTTGIQLEISAKALLAGNQTIGGGTGVMVYNTSDVRILNSDFGQGTYNGISLKQDARRPSTSSTGQDPRMKGGDSAMTWVTANIYIANNVFGSPGDNQIRAIDMATSRPVDSWNVTITGNLFNNKAAGGPDMVAWGRGDNKSFEMYQTPSALASAKNTGWVNAMVSSAKSITQMESDAAAKASIAVPLSSEVAGLLEVSTGTKSLGSAF